MPQLPTRDDLGPLPSARTGRVIASFDGSAIGRGQAAAGQAVAQGLDVLGRGISALGGTLADIGQKQQAFDTEAKFQEFQWNEALKFEQDKRSVAPDQIGAFADTWNKGYVERAKAFKAGVPMMLKGQIDQKLFGVNRKLLADALSFQFDEQKQVSLNTINDATANIYVPKARNVATEDLDGIATEAGQLIQTNPNLTPIEKDDAYRKTLRQIAIAHVSAMPPDKIQNLLETPGLQSQTLSALTAEDRTTFLERADRQLQSVENDAEADKRAGITKFGYDLLKDDKMTPEWIQANRDVLSVSDYKTFLRATAPGAQTRKTEPKEYLRLYDLVQSAPDQAKDELRSLYANEQIAKEDFNKLYNMAERTIEGPSYDSEIRGYVKRLLQPEQDAPSSHYARQMDAMFAFDDWLENHPNARREEMRKAADEIVGDFKKIRYSSGITELPIPQNISKPRDKIEAADLEASKQKLIDALKAGEIDEREAANQAALLRRWYAIIGDRD